MRVGILRGELAALGQDDAVLGQAVVRLVAGHMVDPDAAVSDERLGAFAAAAYNLVRIRNLEATCP